MKPIVCKAPLRLCQDVLCCLGFGTALLLTAPAADAGSVAQLQHTNYPGAFTYGTPPAGFMPEAASDAELARWGYPPRPTDPTLLHRWRHTLLASRHHIEQPLLAPSPLRHGVAQPAGDIGPNYESYSTNWSGFILSNDYVFAESGPYPAPYVLSPPAAFGAGSFYVINGDWPVPVARQAQGACIGALYSSEWVGIDGWVQSNDVLQAGTEADSSCANGVTTATYYAWYEWAPAPAMIVKNLPVGAGDDIVVYVWNDDPTHGHAYIANVGTGDYVNLAFSAPPGVRLIGDSAEWIVETQPAGAGYSDGVSIPNYGQTFMVDAYATTHDGDGFSPGAQGKQSMINVSLCDAPCHNKLSAATLVGPAAIEFAATGLALDGQP